MYHLFLSCAAAWYYGHPSRKLAVVGVTGTGGKSSTVYILAKLLQAAGWKVGATSTLFFKVGEWEQLNNKKMTMLGRFQTQRFLRRMVDAGCQAAIVETTSQGIAQHRHHDIDYDIVALTNLYPEHLEAHGGFENYKKAKGELFKGLMISRAKPFLNFQKTVVVNGDDEAAEYFLSFPAGRKIAFGLNNKFFDKVENIVAIAPRTDGVGLSFKVGETEIQSELLSIFNLYNVLCAITIARALGLEWLEIARAVATIKAIPGRFEFVDMGQSFKVMVDYAFEPRAMEGLYELVKMIPHQRIIHVLGSAGGGRDESRRPKLGAMAGRNADVVIITNEDPYDDDPRKIMEQVAEGARSAGKTDGRDLFVIEERRPAIAKALALSAPQDMVLITGKGAEQAICVKNNRKIPWDDREVVKEEINKNATVDR